MTEKKLQCRVCKKQVANTPNVLARHLRSAHAIEWPDYVVVYELDGKWPLCACGCNQRLVWKKGGFGKYLKGHDSQAPKQRVTFAGPGWVVNPFTGQEEHLGFDDEVAFLEHCVEKNDPVTHDHGIRVGWEDASGKLRVLVPSFKHLRKKLIISIDSSRDPGFEGRLAGLKTWCDEHSYMMLVLRRDSDGFDVVGAHRGKGIEDAKEENEG